MSALNSITREVGFMVRDSAVMIWIVVVFCLSVVTVWSGMGEVQYQRDTITRLLDADEGHRTEEFSKQNNWGGAAYYTFHLTYDSPSDFAFAAMGQRDSAPWKHRVRMLALEGQIYEHDTGNPVIALVGRFDFAFFAAFVLPLVLIFLLHDLHASERVAGRYNLLLSTTGSPRSLWWTRALLRSSGILIAAILPLLIAGFISGTSVLILLSAALLVFAYIVFWTFLCLWFASWEHTAPVILSALIGVWILLSTIVPATGRMVIDGMVPVPSGADILMTQREAVNDAWDLPKQDTMDPFVERYPEWADYTEMSKSFEWKWYYAFQQVGDQKTEQLSNAYVAGRVKRDRLAGLLTLIAPPALLERSLQHLANTDVQAALSYESRVRAFHAELRAFYYPGLFRGDPFEQSTLKDLPTFSAN